MYLDLLVLDLEREMSLSPQGLAARIRAMQNPSVVIIDEIQKVPALLNEVHRLMEGEFRTTQFVLTGSSARQPASQNCAEGSCSTLYWGLALSAFLEYIPFLADIYGNTSSREIAMYKRLLDLPKDESILLLGPRGTGKSTLLQSQFPKETTAWFDLLNLDTEAQLAKHPESLRARTLALPPTVTHIILDEIQKLPILMDVVHSLIESTPKHFVLSGSSARKLKRGGANLLAGRALAFDLFPLTSLEIGEDLIVEEILAYGTLPKVISSTSSLSKRRFLSTYAHTYLKEEIQQEQLIRQIDPFRKFLQVAAQCSGKIVNHAAIAKQVGVDPKTVTTYYQVLEDTLLGFYLEPFHTSVRKRLAQKPKFYFFDTGVQRALLSQLTLPVRPGTSDFGALFECFIINECKRLSRYFENDFSFYFIQTRDNVEIDLVVERPGMPLLLVEIKSASAVLPQHLTPLRTLGSEFPDSEKICLSCVSHAEQYDDVLVIPWQQGLRDYFCGSAVANI